MVELSSTIVIVITCMMKMIERFFSYHNAAYFIIPFDVFELAVSRCQISVKSMYMCPVELSRSHW